MKVEQRHWSVMGRGRAKRIIGEKEVLWQNLRMQRTESDLHDKKAGRDVEGGKRKARRMEKRSMGWQRRRNRENLVPAEERGGMSSPPSISSLGATVLTNRTCLAQQLPWLHGAHGTLFWLAMRKRGSLGASEDFHPDRRKKGGETPLLLLPTGS